MVTVCVCCVHAMTHAAARKQFLFSVYFILLCVPCCMLHCAGWNSLHIQRLEISVSSISQSSRRYPWKNAWSCSFSSCPSSPIILYLPPFTCLYLLTSGKAVMRKHSSAGR